MESYQTLSFLFQDSEKSEGLYEKELNLEPLILYLCRLYDCFAISIRRLKQSTGSDDCQAISIRRLKRSPGLMWIAVAIFICRLKQSTGLF